MSQPGTIAADGAHSGLQAFARTLAAQGVVASRGRVLARAGNRPLSMLPKAAYKALAGAGPDAVVIVLLFVAFGASSAMGADKTVILLGYLVANVTWILLRERARHQVRKPAQAALRATEADVALIKKSARTPRQNALPLEPPRQTGADAARIPLEPEK